MTADCKKSSEARGAGGENGRKKRKKTLSIPPLKGGSSPPKGELEGVSVCVKIVCYACYAYESLEKVKLYNAMNAGS